MFSSSSNLQGALRLEPEPGKLALYYLLFSHGLMLAAFLALVSGGVSPAVGLLLLIAMSFAYQVAAFWLRILPYSLVTLHLQGPSVRLDYRNGSSRKGVLCRRQFVTPLLVVVSVRDTRMVHRIVPFADQIPGEILRRLRVQLRFPLDAADT